MIVKKAKLRGFDLLDNLTSLDNKQKTKRFLTFCKKLKATVSKKKKRRRNIIQREST